MMTFTSNNLSMRLSGKLLALLAIIAGSSAEIHAQRPDSPAAVKHYFTLIRPIFDPQKAYDQTAFMDQYFRWPGNTGFNASIKRVQGILEAAGYVEQSKANIEAFARLMDGLTWDCVRGKRDKLPPAIDAFHRDAQVARVGAFITEILEAATTRGRAR